MGVSTLGNISLIAQGGSALSGAIGSYYSAAQQRSALEGRALSAEADAFAAQTNARIAEMGAQSTLQQGQHQVAQLTLKAGQLKSAQRAAMAANGVDLGEGSAADIQAGTDFMKEIDSNQITANALRSAWGYRMQAGDYTNQARMSSVTAQGLRSGARGVKPGIAGLTSLIGGAAGVAESWYKLQGQTPATKTAPKMEWYD